MSLKAEQVQATRKFKIGDEVALATNPGKLLGEVKATYNFGSKSTIIINVVGSTAAMKYDWTELTLYAPAPTGREITLAEFLEVVSDCTTDCELAARFAVKICRKLFNDSLKPDAVATLTDEKLALEIQDVIDELLKPVTLETSDNDCRKVLLAIKSLLKIGEVLF
jgi:hypothetical protein